MSLFWADWIGQSVPTTGTGSTLSLGGALPGHRTLEDASAPDGSEVLYFLSDGNDRERASGIYDEGMGTLTRITLESTTGSPLDLTGAARLYLGPSVTQIVFIADLEAAEKRATGIAIALGG